MKTIPLYCLVILGFAWSPISARADSVPTPEDELKNAARSFQDAVNELRDYREDVNETIVRDLINQLIAREFPKIRQRNMRAEEVLRTQDLPATFGGFSSEAREFERNAVLIKSIHRVAEGFQKAIVAPGGLYPVLEDFSQCVRALIRDDQTISSLEKAGSLLNDFYESYDRTSPGVLSNSTFANPPYFLQEALTEEIFPWRWEVERITSECSSVRKKITGAEPKVRYTLFDIHDAAYGGVPHDPARVETALKRIAFPTVERIDMPATLHVGVIVVALELTLGKIYRLTDGTAYLAPIGIKAGIEFGPYASVTLNSYAVDGSGSSKWLNGEAFGSLQQFSDRDLVIATKSRSGHRPPIEIYPLAAPKDSLVGVGVGFGTANARLIEGGLDLTIPAAGLCTTKGDYLLCVPRPDGTPWRKPRKMSIASDVWENGDYDVERSANDW